MSTSQMIIILSIVGLYLAMMLYIGFKYSKAASSEQYFLGGRKLNGWVAAFSAEASVMSGWMLLGFPGVMYAMGMGQIWCAVGCFLGSAFNYIFIANRLRKYSRLNGAITVPQYLGRRFRTDNSKIQTIAGFFIILFFVVYAASGLISGGKLLNSLFGIEYSLGIFICTVVILVYTFLGGFDAVCKTDFIQGLIMLVALITVPIIAWTFVSNDVIELLSISGVNAKIYLNPSYDAGKPITLVNIISQLGWALAYSGLPHIIVRFMAIKDEREIQKTRIIGLTIDFVGLVAAIAIGLIGRAYLVPKILESGASETVYIETLKKLFLSQWEIPVLCGVFIAGIVASIMSSSDSMLLTSASTLSEDFYRGFVNKNAEDKDVIKVGRIAIIIVSVLAMLFALDPNGGVFKISSIAWAGLGATFGPTVILSLYWKRMTHQGAIAGMLTGGVLVAAWEYLPVVEGLTLSVKTGLYSIVPSFFVSMIVILVVSLITPVPGEEVQKEFCEVIGK